MSRLLQLAVTLVLCGAPAVADAATWRIDPIHSTVEFKVRHLMVSWVKGVFPDVKGRIDIDDADLSKASVEVTIDVASIDTNNSKREKHLRTPDFFDVITYPDMTFVSKRIVADGDQLRQVIGDLTIRGTTREVTLEVAEFTPAIKDPAGKTRRGATATTAINRKDFGLVWNDLMESGGVVVGDEVRIALDVQLVRD